MFISESNLSGEEQQLLNDMNTVRRALKMAGDLAPYFDASNGESGERAPASALNYIKEAGRYLVIAAAPLLTASALPHVMRLDPASLASLWVSAGLLAAYPLLNVVVFALGSARIHWAINQHTANQELISEFNSPEMIRLSELSKEYPGAGVEKYRNDIAFILGQNAPEHLRGRMVINDTALSFLSAVEQKAILAEELMHLGLTTIEEYEDLARAGKLAVQPQYGEFRAKLEAQRVFWAELFKALFASPTPSRSLSLKWAGGSA